MFFRFTAVEWATLAVELWEPFWKPAPRVHLGVRTKNGASELKVIPSPLPGE